VNVNVDVNKKRPKVPKIRRKPPRRSEETFVIEVWSPDIPRTERDEVIWRRLTVSGSRCFTLCKYISRA